jgi:hypothetical protein
MDRPATDTLANMGNKTLGQGVLALVSEALL